MLTDMTFVRVVFTLIAFASFLALVGWAWSASRRAGFDEAAALPFDDGLESKRPGESS